MNTEDRKPPMWYRLQGGFLVWQLDDAGQRYLETCRVCKRRALVCERIQEEKPVQWQ